MSKSVLKTLNLVASCSKEIARWCDHFATNKSCWNQGRGNHTSNLDALGGLLDHSSTTEKDNEANFVTTDTNNDDHTL